MTRKPDHNLLNEQYKRRYLRHLREARGRHISSLDAVAKALNRFEESTVHKDFSKFHQEQAIAFKRKLLEQRSKRTGEKLSLSTVYSTLKHLRSFFLWLADQHGCRSRLSHSDADYFNLSDKDARIAKSRTEKQGPTLEEMHCVILGMPAGNELEMRDQAMVALVLLTGVRDGALVTLKLRHLDLTKKELLQRPADGVETKFSKAFSTFWFPVGGNAAQIVERWVSYLKDTLGWGPSDPLFPATEMGMGPDRRFRAIGVKREHWRSAQPVRYAFKTAFSRIGLQYHPPHSVRKTLAVLGEQICRSPEELKAWSQNLGHTGVLTTFISYGAVATGRQSEIIRSLGNGTAGGRERTQEERLARLEAALF